MGVEVNVGAGVNVTVAVAGTGEGGGDAVGIDSCTGVGLVPWQAVIRRKHPRKIFFMTLL
jgi:hypothetical protein